MRRCVSTRPTLQSTRKEQLIVTVCATLQNVTLSGYIKSTHFQRSVVDTMRTYMSMLCLRFKKYRSTVRVSITNSNMFNKWMKQRWDYVEPIVC